jgi:hypothetical protein
MKRILVCLLVLFTVAFMACSQTSISGSNARRAVDLPYSGPITLESQEYRGEAFDPTFGTDFYSKLYHADKVDTFEENINTGNYSFSNQDLFKRMVDISNNSSSFYSITRGSRHFLDAIHAYVSFPGLKELLVDYYSNKTFKTFYSSTYDPSRGSRNFDEDLFEEFISYALSHASSFKFGRGQVWTYKLKIATPEPDEEYYDLYRSNMVVYLTVYWGSERYSGDTTRYHVIRDYGSFNSLLEE